MRKELKMDKCREEFEAWLVSYCDEINYHCKNKVLLQNASGYYKMSWVDSAWIGWKASRETMRAIKLPDIYDNKFYCDNYVQNSFGDEVLVDTFKKDDYKASVDKAITSAGYKVEE